MTMSAKIETLRPDHSAITGYVDELREDRVWGWAWDRRSPSLRVEIQVWIGDNPVATALADRPRPDLKANGLGDLRKLSGVEPRPPAKAEPSADAATPERLAAIEAVLMRVDASLADLAHKVEAAAKPGESGRIPAWLYAAIAAAAAVLATAFVMLGLTR